MPKSRSKTIHDDAYQLLVDCIHTARQTAQLTQTELAKRLGVDQSYVSKYERAERRLDVLELRSVCRALKIGFQEFISDFEKELKKQGLS